MPLRDPPGSLRSGFVVALGVLVLLRIAQYLSIVTLIYDDELTEMIRLALDVHDASFVFNDFNSFVQKYTFQPFSQGTLVLQILTVAFSYLMGPTSWALLSSVLLLETIAFGFFLALGVHLGGPKGLGLAALLWLVASPASVVAVQLMPYGIHTEFLFVPLGGIALAVLRPPSTWQTGHWIAASLWIALGIVLFRSNLFPALAFTATMLLLQRGRTAVLAVVALAGGCLIAAGCLDWLSPGGWDSMPQHVSPKNWAPLSVLDRIPELLGVVLPAPRIPGPLAFIWRFLLLLGIPLALFLGLRRRSPKSLVLVFAAIWAILSLAAVVILGELQLRYLCPPFYALLLCWLMLGLEVDLSARTRTAVGVALAALLLGGGADGLRLIHPSVWSQTASFEAGRVGQELQVRYVELDELPYWQRILEEGRGSQWIGGLGDLLGRCSNLPLTDPRVHTIRHPAKLDCRFEESESTTLVLRALQDWTGDDVPIEKRLLDMGRGAWIRNGRDLKAMSRALADVEPTQRKLLMEGARDEARRWAQGP